MGGPFGKILHKVCCCGGDPCCPNRCIPYVSEEFPGDCPGDPGDNPLPLELDCTLTVSTVKNDPITGLPSGCFTCTGTLSYSPSTDSWIGVVTGSCSGWCGETTRIFEYLVTISCGLNPDGSISWFAEIQDNVGGTSTRVCPAPFSDPPVWALFESTCDPILLTGQSTSFLCSDLQCVIPAHDPPIDEVFGDIIFDIVASEVP